MHSSKTIIFYAKFSLLLNHPSNFRLVKNNQPAAKTDKAFLVYNASAGSGKTYTLVREFLLLALKSGYDDAFKSILAITFTNKASTEMKARVLEALENIATENSKTHDLCKELAEKLGIDSALLPAKAKQLLRIILHQYGDFSIGTIDSFMHRVVRTFAYDLHLPVSFSVELKKENLIDQAIDQILDMAGLDEEITEVLIGFNRVRSDEEKNPDIRKELSNMAKDLLDDTKSAYVAKLSELPIRFFLQLHQTSDAQRKNYLNQVRELGTYLIDLLNQHSVELSDLKGGELRSIGAFWAKAAEGEENLKPSDTALGYYQKDEWFSGKCSKANQAVIKTLIPDFRSKTDTLLDLIEKNRSSFIINTAICNSVFSMALLREISSIIDKIRSEQHTLHISEFNRRVAEIVMHEPAPFVYERLGEKYAHYLIDEFQDTSITQWQNLLPLVQNGLATASKSLLVGDGKQAIYRFRGGDVEQFIRMPKPYPSNLSDTQLERYRLLDLHYDSIPLDTNYRSLPEIVNWNNAFYQKLATQLQPEHAALYENLNQKSKEGKTGGYVAVHFLGDGSEKIDAYKEIAGQHIVLLLSELTRNDRYEKKDIAILTRDNKSGTYLANLLLEKGIPVISGESLLVKGKPEVQFLLAWLRVLCNTDVQVNLLHICGFLLERKQIAFPSLEALLETVRMEEEHAMRMLQTQGFDVDSIALKTQNIAEVVHKLCNIFKFEINSDSFLQFFLEAVWFAGDQTNPDIPSFLEKWSNIESEYSVTLPQNANAVRIMSIHKSKGLEFPVVILAFAVNETDKGSYFWVDDVQHLPEGLPAMRLKFNANLRDTVFKPYFDEEQSKKALDRINLLYVATTRAENALYIISRKKAGESVGWASYLKSFCQQQPDFNGVFYEWGDSHHTKSDNGKSSAKQNHPARSQAYSIGNWHLKIDLNSKIFQAFDSDAIRLGNLMHTALSWIKTPSDFDTAMQRLNASALASEKELAEVKYRLEILLNNDTIKPIFNDFDAVYIERNILLSTGAVLRPDRVVVKEKATTIVEFKTGVFDEKHILQTKEYLTVLKSMQPENNLKALLIYLGDTPECIAVE